MEGHHRLIIPDDHARWDLRGLIGDGPFTSFSTLEGHAYE